MKLRTNRRVERAGVNAAQSLFESQCWIFQPVGGENDYGKDAYVDAASGDTVTGLCAALQVKSGESFRRSNGDYALPIGQHEQIWRESPMPVMGIIHDPERGQLYWCNISSFLRDHPYGAPSAIPVRAEDVLNAETLSTNFLASIRRTAGMSPGAGSPLDLCSDSADHQVAAIFNAFALAALDPRGMILVRRLLTTFREDALFTAIHVLLQIERHRATAATIAAALRWTVPEILHLLTHVGWELWQRGDVGEEVYALLVKDPSYEPKVRQAVGVAVESGLDDAAWAAVYLVVYWAGHEGRAVYEQLVTAYPQIRTLPLAGELEWNLREAGGTDLF